jgi:alkylated DNA nucleotide flippase Atl1
MPSGIKMTKREEKFIRDFKKKMAVDMARHTREARKKAFAEVMGKEKVETYGDIFAILDGLSRRAKEAVVYGRIHHFVALGRSPKQIIDIMEPKKEKGNEKTAK